jgi:hypothetical protein
MFHWGRLSLTLVQNFLRKFCKENDSLMNWNEINDFFDVSSVLIIDLVSLILSLYLFQHLICSKNYKNNDFLSNILFIKKQLKHL